MSIDAVKVKLQVRVAFQILIPLIIMQSGHPICLHSCLHVGDRVQVMN